ncbi:MAG: A/G-specific adenine glycosylase [Planctomycetaceae bacterium]|nr:A/G-specific adenine glycosylase [Planctomycetaceae bacterium]
MKQPLSLPPLDDRAFARALTAWYDRARRPLPFRETCDPYSIWISEIMLQQTQMERGVAYYRRWMQRFPDVGAVAAADEDTILAAWEGLGYYSRARNLHAAAKRIVSRFDGIFPRDVDDIRALPGVGEYTAGAIASIAFDLPVPAVDANVLRIFSRLFDIDVPVADRRVREAVSEAVRRGLDHARPRVFNQALMELGALVCGKAPRCGGCPVALFCLARERGTVAERPAGRVKTVYREVETAAGVIIRGGRVLVHKRPPGGVWPGLWEFPGGVVPDGETPESALVRIVRELYGMTVERGEKIGVFRHGYTTNRITMHGYYCRVAGSGSALGEAPEGAWMTSAELSGLAFASGHRKLLERLGWKQG